MTTDVYKNALATVTWPYEGRIPAIHCPVTGMPASLGFSPEQDPAKDSPKSPADQNCPTLIFRYNYEVGIEYIRPELAEAIATKKRQLVESGDADDEADLDDLEIISEHLDSLGNAPLIIDMPTYGLPGDGIVIGFDLARAYK